MTTATRIEKEFLERFPDRIITIDSHTQGEPTRILIGGTGPLSGDTIKAKRDDFEYRYDIVRKLLTREPRGHRGIMAAVVTEPVTPEASFGLFYMDARRYPYLCGHATIGAVAAMIETGAMTVPEGNGKVVVDTPSGPLTAYTEFVNGSVKSVSIDMVPSFVLDTNRTIKVPSFGELTVHLVCVGGFFVMVSSESVGIPLNAANSSKLIPLGMEIIDAANEALTVYHPERPEVSTVDVTEFYEETSESEIGRNAVVYGESHMDRSPCGTGTTAKMTLLHHFGKLKPGEIHKNAGPLGTVFEGRIVRTTSVGPFGGIIARITGNAQITGFHQFVVDSNDTLPQGFLL